MSNKKFNPETESRKPLEFPATMENPLLLRTGEAKNLRSPFTKDGGLGSWWLWS